MLFTKQLASVRGYSHDFLGRAAHGRVIREQNMARWFIALGKYSCRFQDTIGKMF